MDQMEWNRQIIAEFRANGGKVGGRFAGMPMLLLTAKGAKSGTERTTPLVCTQDGEDLVIIASKAGAPEHPAWYHNLRTNAEVAVEYGTEAFRARATVTEGDERDRLYAAAAAIMPGFNEYQAKTTRRIPVVRLTRIA